nr:YeeE/YedE thiosulfate transporter family protein [uncultured Allomuricauda sp.]
MEMIYQPWPWYVSGPLIALVMFILIMTGKRFGMSSNLRTLCTICGAGKHADFFRFDWKSQRWNLIVVAGVIIGGFIGANFLSPETSVAIADDTITKLQTLGIESAGSAYMPTELFGNTVFSNFKGLILLIVGGFLVGFGARYAGGCTSGHAISGLSNLQLPSLIAVIGFFIGGLFMVHVLFPMIF